MLVLLWFWEKEGKTEPGIELNGNLLGVFRRFFSALLAGSWIFDGRS
jgi:hypothetical protein